MRESVTELLTRVNALSETIQRAQALFDAGNGRLQEILFYALDPSVKWDVPEGVPPYTPDIDVNTHGNFWQEIRKIPNLFMGGKLNHIPQRREHLFIQMLESIHPKDAELLCAIKDHEWPYENINREVVNMAFPNLIGE